MSESTLDSLHASLRSIGWLDPQLPPPPQPDDRLTRVVAHHRASLEVHDGETLFSAKPVPRLRHAKGDSSQRPTVGDWVWMRAHGDEWHVVEMLERRSALIRGAAGERYGRQALAVNVDQVLVVVGADRDFNLRRVERYLALISASGAMPVIVLTKADKLESEEAQQYHEALAEITQVPLFVINAKDPLSVAPLLAHLAAGETAVLVGSSGAGKSTLTNTLAGLSLRTGEVRGRDGRGRHTTVARQLVRLPGGACLIDTPGLREIKFTGEEQPVAQLFDDVEGFAGQCRFRNCEHAEEPDCAVQDAIESGGLAEERLASWRKLGEETAERQQAAQVYARRQSRRSPTRGR